MDWRIEFDINRRIARIIASGDFLVEDCTKSILELLASDFWLPGISVLCDFRDTIFFGINLDRLRVLCAYHERRSVEIGAGRLALLMGSPRDFGFARQYEMITDGKILSQVGVFLDEARALDWAKNAEAAELI